MCDAAGRCVCAPSCAGRVCGPNGCGGTCGTCPSRYTCTSAGACQEPTGTLVVSVLGNCVRAPPNPYQTLQVYRTNGTIFVGSFMVPGPGSFQIPEGNATIMVRTPDGRVPYPNHLVVITAGTTVGITVSCP